jgi:hypothetical protein
VRRIPPPTEVGVPFRNASTFGDIVPDPSRGFVEVELERGDRALEFGRAVEKLDRDDSSVRHLEAFRGD